MAASINDLITAVMNGGAPVPTTVSSIRTPGANTLACVALTHWPVVSAVHFVTGTPMTDAEGNAVINPTSLALWKAIVSGTTLTGLLLEASATGSDPGNSVNDIVQMAPDSAWAQDLYTALTAEHNTLGQHTAATEIAGNNVANALLEAWNTVSDSWVFASANTVTIPSDATTKYDVGDYVMFTQSAAVAYYRIAGVTSTVLTLIGVNGAVVANSAITAVSYSKGRNPHNLPLIAHDWEEIGRDTVTGSARATLEVLNLPARKYLRICIAELQSGSTDGFMYFNNDTGANYGWRRSVNGGADVTNASAGNWDFLGDAAQIAIVLIDILNVATSYKIGHASRDVTEGGPAVPAREVFTGMWSNTSAAINRIDYPTAVGSWAVGTEMIVYGKN